VNSGKVVSSGGMTFAKFVTEHWTPHCEDTMKASARKSHESNINHHLLPALGGLKLSEIQPPRLARLLKEKRAAGMSDKTRLNLYLLLGAMFAYAIDQRLLKVSPLSPADRPRVEPEEKPTLALPRIEAVITAVPSQFRPLFIVLALTGLRIGEVLGLKWADVDFERNSLHIRRSVWMGREQSPKSKRSIREKPLGAILRHALEAQQSLCLSTEPGDYVFAAGNGHALYADDLRKRVLYPAMDKAGITDRKRRAFGFHLFRHSAATHLLQASGNLKTTSSFLGHASTATTGDIYAHTLPDVERADMEMPETSMFPKGLSENLLANVRKISEAVN
jgi:integrase